MSNCKKKNRRRRKSSSATHSAAHASSGKLISDAVALQQAGNLEAAKELYCQVLQSDPLNPDAWHLLGLTLHAAAQNHDALDCLKKADSMIPNHPDVLANLGVVYRSLGQIGEARQVLERSVSINPGNVSSRNTLGTVLLESSVLDAAELQFQAALEIDPNAVNAAMNLANVWQQQGRMRDAEQIYRQLLQRESDNALVLTNLGESLRQQGRWHEASEALETALSIDPMLTATAISLGRTLRNSRRHAEAERLFRQVIAQHPELSKAYHYLGQVLFDLSDMEAAKSEISTALDLDPTDAYALSSLGFVHLEMGQRDAAAECFRGAIDHDPSISEAHGSLLYIMSGDPNANPEHLLEEHERWGELHGAVDRWDDHTNVKRKDRHLRIGYVSPDFRHHAVASFIKPVLESHDASRIEIFCYAEVAVPDETTEQLKQAADHWRSTTGLSNRQVAQQINEDQIDIVVDLAGHTSGNRLVALAHKPAPIQMTWLGYPNTTGLAAIDYRLTCETQNPRGEKTYHVEQLLRIPGGSFCFSPPKNAPDVKPPPVIGNSHVPFGSLHRPFKISDPVRDLWANVLMANPDSKMLIFNTRFTSESQADLAKALVERGVESSRFEIRNTYHSDSYLETYHEIDIALDVSPWAGGTTTLEALWMGVPVIAHYGSTRSARSTAAIVKNAGHPELIAVSAEQYVQIANGLANNHQRLQKLRCHLRNDVKQTIVNADRFTRELENTYRQAWNIWCSS